MSTDSSLLALGAVAPRFTAEWSSFAAFRNPYQRWYARGLLTLEHNLTALYLLFTCKSAWDVLPLLGRRAGKVEADVQLGGPVPAKAGE